MKYHSGDMVKIKSLDKIKRLMEFNKGPGRNPRMTPMCGGIYKIEMIDYSHYYRICDERGTERSFLEERLEDKGIALFI